jgi:hypothetical protein
MILIRVICNFYDDWVHKRQLRRERLEWLRISRRFGLYKDLRILVEKEYLQRIRVVNGDSYKIFFLTILFICTVAHGLTMIEVDVILFRKRILRWLFEILIRILIWFEFLFVKFLLFLLEGPVILYHYLLPP